MSDIHRVFFLGSKLDLQKQFPRSGLQGAPEGHFDITVDLADYTRQDEMLYKTVSDARFLFEIGHVTKKSVRKVFVKLSTLPNLIDALPDCSFFFRSDAPIRLPEKLTRRLNGFASSPASHASNRQPKFMSLKIHPLLYREFLKGTLHPGLRYSGALVAAMISIERVRRLEGPQ